VSLRITALKAISVDRGANCVVDCSLRLTQFPCSNVHLPEQGIETRTVGSSELRYVAVGTRERVWVEERLYVLVMK